MDMAWLQAITRDKAFLRFAVGAWPQDEEDLGGITCYFLAPWQGSTPRSYGMVMLHVVAPLAPYEGEGGGEHVEILSNYYLSNDRNLHSFKSYSGESSLVPPRSIFRT